LRPRRHGRRAARSSAFSAVPEAIARVSSSACEDEEPNADRVVPARRDQRPAAVGKAGRRSARCASGSSGSLWPWVADRVAIASPVGGSSPVARDLQGIVPAVMLHDEERFSPGDCNVWLPRNLPERGRSSPLNPQAACRLRG
jgi:hypothetical protein